MTIKNLPFTSSLRGTICLIYLCIFSNHLFATNPDWPLPPPDTIVVSLTLECGEDSLLLCGNLNGLGGSLSSTFACSAPVNGTLTFDSDSCFYYFPNPGFEGDDETCIVICNDANECDTFYFEIFVESCVGQIPCADIPYDLLIAHLDDCNDLVKICNPFPLGEALLYDFTIDNVPYNGNLGVCSFDTLYSYSFSSIPDGGQVGPYELVSWEINGEIFSGNFNEIDELIELMNMFDLNGNWQFDQATSNVFTFNTTDDYGQMTIMQIATNDMAILSRNSTTAPIGSSIYIPTGVHEIVLQHQDASYCRDTFMTAVNCDTYRENHDTVNINETKNLCLSSSSVPGNLQSVEAKCFNCQSLIVTVNGNCMEYESISPGRDSVLVTGCDEFGLCDTTLQIVTVMDNTMLPTARIDFDTTEENTDLPLDLFSNDDFNGDLKNIFIIIYPQHGLVNISTDFSMTYTPDSDFCGMDAFAYEICNENGCDTSTVTILVRCKTPMVYNGFSPNEDGKNDTFTIFNIEEYPLNHLRVYNRWGNLIYYKKNYKNEWDGRSLQNNLLPDGTYFYVFEVEGQEGVKGFVQINR